MAGNKVRQGVSECGVEISGHLVWSEQFLGSSSMHSLWQFTPQFEHWKPYKENYLAKLWHFKEFVYVDVDL